MTGTLQPWRLHRSELAVPATSERFLLKAAQSTADIVFLDLEDAVAPHLKDDARAAAIAGLNGIDWGRRTVCVRVNSLGTPWMLRDVTEIARSCKRLDMIMLPKAESAFDVQFVAGLLTSVELEVPRSRPVGLSVLIETARGVARTEEIAAASDRLEAMVFGVGDYSVDMRTPDLVFGRPNPDYAVLTDTDAEGRRSKHWNDQWHFALARIANACRANGLRPIDGPYTDYRDEEGLRSSARRARSLGFEGKMAIHPSQIEPINAVFSPESAHIAWARQTLDALEVAKAAGRGAVGVGGILVDLAHEKRAREILQRHEAIEGMR